MPETPAATPTEPTPGSEEYNAKMVERLAEGTGTPSNEAHAEKLPVAAMPENGVEKFYDTESGAYNWGAHVKELEYKLSQSPGKKDAESAPAKDAEENADDSTIKDVVERAGLKLDDLASQIREDGALADEARAALVAQGVPESLINDYVEMAVERVERSTSDAVEYVGGKDEWNALSEWASANLPEGEKARYNAMLSSPDWKVAVDTLKTKRGPVSAEGRLEQGNAPAGSVSGYRSRAEQKADQQDKRYSKDPSFRRQVIAKINISTYPDDGY